MLLAVRGSLRLSFLSIEPAYECEPLSPLRINMHDAILFFQDLIPMRSIGSDYG
jgi:hypothetical protein